jgi:hypothetical protein
MAGAVNISLADFLLFYKGMDGKFLFRKVNLVSVL